MTKYIISLSKDRYVRMREERELVKRSQPFMVIDQDDRVLIYLKDENKIIAEYDIAEVKLTEKQIRIGMEPIYNAPPNAGVKVTDIMLLQLTTHSSVTQWKYLLNKSIIQISDNDYDTITTKLMD